MRRIWFMMLCCLLAGCGSFTPTIEETAPTAVSRVVPSPTPAKGGVTVLPSPSTDAFQQLSARPLTVPTLPAGNPCPVTTTPYKQLWDRVGPLIGQGAAYIGGWRGEIEFGQISEHNYGSLGIWREQKVMWVRDGAVYSGPLLIRGRQIDGTGKVHITSSKTDAQSGAALFLAPIAATWLDIPSSTLVSAPGCYAYQVDGMNFTYHIVFQAKYAP